MKTELYRWLKMEWPTVEALEDGAMFPPGACHFPQYGEEFFKQLTAERRVIRVTRGMPTAIWEKDPTRNNEALDCRVYARAAAAIYGLDRMSEYKWRQIERSLGEFVEEQTKGVELPVTQHSAQTAQKTKSANRFAQRKTVKADDPYL